MNNKIWKIQSNTKDNMIRLSLILIFLFAMSGSRAYSQQVINLVNTNSFNRSILIDSKKIIKGDSELPLKNEVVNKEKQKDPEKKIKILTHESEEKKLEIMDHTTYFHTSGRGKYRPQMKQNWAGEHIIWLSFREGLIIDIFRTNSRSGNLVGMVTYIF